MALQWHLGDIVRKLREQRGWNQSQLGVKSGGLNKATIVRVEENGNVKRETLEAVARGLGMTLGELYALIPTTTQGQETRRPEATTETIPKATGTAGRLQRRHTD